MATAGYSLISSILGDKGPDFINLDIPDVFFRTSEQEVWSFVQEHFAKYGVVPAEETIQAQFEEFNASVVAEPPEFYVERMRQRHFLDMIRRAMMKAKGMMDVTKDSFDVYGAFDALMGSLLELKFSDSARSVVDFRNSFDMLHKEYIKVLTLGEEYGIRMGWPTLDNMSGGLVGDDVVAILGRPAAGKTFMVIKAGHYCWEMGKRVLILSMEMKPLPILQRIATIHTQYNLTKFKKAEMSTKYKNQVFGALKEVEGHATPFYIADGNLSANVREVLLLCQQLNPEVVFIDGAYLLRGKHDRMGTTEKVTSTIEGLKREVSSKLGIPVIASYQFNREAAKKQSSPDTVDDIGLEDIGYSDAVGQISSLVLGMLQKESIETALRREVTVLKGRGGEKGKFIINWDFRQMNFGEIVDKSQDHGKLEFL